MNPIRPRRARLLGTITLILGLLASLVGATAASATGDLPEPVGDTQAAATAEIRCDGAVPVVVFTFYNWDTEDRLFNASHWATLDEHLVGDQVGVPGALPGQVSTVVMELPGDPGVEKVAGITSNLVVDPNDIRQLIPHHTVDNPCPSPEEVEDAETTQPTALLPLAFYPELECVPVESGQHLKRWTVDVTNPNTVALDYVVRIDNLVPFTRTADAGTEYAPAVSGFAAESWMVGDETTLEITHPDTGSTLYGPITLADPCVELQDGEPDDEVVPDSNEEIPGEPGVPTDDVSEPELPTRSTAEQPPAPPVPTTGTTTVPTTEVAPAPEPVRSAPTGEVESEVLAADVEVAPSAPAQLPRTGSNTITLLALGLAMSLVGVALVAFVGEAGDQAAAGPCSRMRAMTSRAASGMFVPGPNTAATPAAVRTS